ncbi:MAG: iron-containing alcohol dehydrogenase [Christensenellales bacterium]
MKSFEFQLKTHIIFGVDAEKKIAEVLKKMGKKKIMLICDAFLKGGTLLSNIEKLLEEAGIEYMEDATVLPNPKITDIRAKVKAALDSNIDFIVAVGGGSSIDTAKAVSIGVASPETDVADFFTGKASVNKVLGSGVILTLAATGSETSMSCMMTLNENDLHIKGSASSPVNRPEFCLLNPEIAYTAPVFQIGCGAADIYMHTLDRYFSTVDGNETTDQIAEAILRVVKEKGPIAVRDPRNYDAMSELMWCSGLSHNGLTHCGRPMDFSVHKLGNCFSGMFKEATHGAVMAILWPAWAKYVYKNNIRRFARYARNVMGVVEECDEKAALKGIDATVRFFTDGLKMPATFKELKLEISDEEMKSIALANTNNGVKKYGDFIALDWKDSLEIYKQVN